MSVIVTLDTARRSQSIKIDNNFRCEKSRISILSIFIEFIDSAKYQ